MLEGADKAALQIVGIVGDVHEGSLIGVPKPEFYVPFLVHPPQAAYLAVRTEGDPLPFVHAFRRQVSAIDGNQPVSEIRTMDDLLEATLGERRFTM